MELNKFEITLSGSVDDNGVMVRADGEGNSYGMYQALIDALAHLTVQNKKAGITTEMAVADITQKLFKEMEEAEHDNNEE